MASRFVISAKKGARSLDLPVAGLAALSAGFILFSLPQDLLEQLVGSTGIGNFLAAAQPPLGGTARIAASIAAAALAFTLVYLLFRLIDRKPTVRSDELEMDEEPETPRKRRIIESADPESEPAGLRLRRWDAHPDAPARRPIFAVSDIGEPEPPQSPLVSKAEKKPKSPAAPFWEPTDFPAADPEEAEAWMDEQQQREHAEEQPLELSSPVSPPGRQPEPEPEPEPQPEAEREPEPEPDPEPAPAPVATAAVEPVRKEPIVGNESIAELMERLERGLSRRQDRPTVEAAHSAAPEPEQAPTPQAFESAGDERLKSAVDNLQRIAARGL
jgi:hypothetical protein